MSTENSNNNQSNISIAVHKAFTGKLAAIRSDLQKFHSDNGKELQATLEGDFIHIHLPSKTYNTVDSIKGTLKDHEGHPAYSPDNIIEKAQPEFGFRKNSIASMREKFLQIDSKNTNKNSI